jgi:hypothetical protein
MDAAQLRPLGVGEIVDAAIRVYRQKFATMVKAVAIVVVPVQVFNVLIRLSLPSSSSTTTTDSTGTVHISGTALSTTLAATVLLLVVGVVSSTLAQAACFKIVGDTYLGTPSDWKGSLRFGFSRFWRLLGLILLHGFLLLIGFALCIVPGIYFYAAWSVAIPVLLIEGTGGFRALSRSSDLVKGRWWPVAGTLLVANLLASFVAGVFSVVLVPLALNRGNENVIAVVGGITGAIGSVLTTPFVAAVVTVLYFDLRVRKEGFDLQLMAWRMGIPSPEGGFRPTPMPWSPQSGWQWGPPPGQWGQQPQWGPPPAQGGQPQWGQKQWGQQPGPPGRPMPMPPPWNPPPPPGWTPPAPPPAPPPPASPPVGPERDEGPARPDDE